MTWKHKQGWVTLSSLVQFLWDYVVRAIKVIVATTNTEMLLVENLNVFLQVDFSNIGLLK